MGMSNVGIKDGSQMNSVLQRELKEVQITSDMQENIQSFREKRDNKIYAKDILEEKENLIRKQFLNNMIITS